MTFRHGHLVAAVGLTLALVSCGAPPTAPPTGSGSDNGASKFQQYENLKGQERRDTLLKDAKAEGEVTLYTSMTSDVAGVVTKAFTDQTGIKVNLYRADSETVLQRILQEARANHAGADVVETDALEMASLGHEQLVEPYTGERRDLDLIKDRKVASLSGIALPESFEQSLVDLGAQLIYSKRFADHHRFTQQEILNAINRSKKRQAELIITTQKDAVRFPKIDRRDLPIFFVRVEIKIVNGADGFQDCVRKICFR